MSNIDLGTPIKALIEISPLNQLSEGDRMIVAGQLAATMQMLLSSVFPKHPDALPEDISPEDEQEDLADYRDFMYAMRDASPTEKLREYFSNEAAYAEKRLQRVKSGTSLEECHDKAMSLLERAIATEMPAPDETWFQEYFALTGEHMILTDEGWTTGRDKAAFPADEILAEVNAPAIEG